MGYNGLEFVGGVGDSLLQPAIFNKQLHKRDKAKVQRSLFMNKSENASFFFFLLSVYISFILGKKSDCHGRDTQKKAGRETVLNHGSEEYQNWT